MPLGSLINITNLLAPLDDAMNVMYKNLLASQENPYPGYCVVRKVAGTELIEVLYEDVFALPFVPEYQPPPLRNMLAQDFILKLAKRGNGIRVRRKDWQAQKDVGLMAKIEQLGILGAWIPRDDISDIFNNGDSSAYPSYDGEDQFANAHPKGGTTYDNLLALPLTPDNLQAAIVQMNLFPSDEGANQPLGINPTNLEVPPGLDKTAREILNTLWIIETSSGSTNVMQGIMDFKKNVKLTDQNDWFVFANDSTTGVKPFIWLMHDTDAPMKIIFIDDPQKYRDELVWEGETWERIWPSHPYLMIKSVVA